MSFNGAGRFHARKAASDARGEKRKAKLQWGRAFSRPEGSLTGREYGSEITASMGPGVFTPGRAFSRSENELSVQLQWGRAFSRPEGEL